MHLMLVSQLRLAASDEFHALIRIFIFWEGAPQARADIERLRVKKGRWLSIAARANRHRLVLQEATRL